MSFSGDVKSELCALPIEGECCCAAELSALIRVGGVLVFPGGGNLTAALRTESAAVARRAFKLVKQQIGAASSVEAIAGSRPGSPRSYRIALPAEQGRELLEKLQIVRNAPGMAVAKHVPSVLTRRVCCKKAYLRGLFLASGWLSAPEARRQLQLHCGQEAYAGSVCRLMAKCGFPARQARRKEEHVVYLKESEHITELLTLIGANDAVIRLQNAQVVKDVRNRVNRQINCDTANLNKTIEAAERQTKALQMFLASGGLESLPDDLRAIAALRIEHPEMSLQELGTLLTPPLGKSGVYHRLRRIVSLAKE